MNIIWLKRDLRIHDHQPIAEAVKAGKVLAVYIYEPEVINQDDFDATHLQFINESLEELRQRLLSIGGSLAILRGRAVEIFEALHARYGVTNLWSHREVGTEVTYKRDREVADWARGSEVAWIEFSQNGVIRKLKSRDGWSKRWQQKVESPIVESPVAIDGLFLDDMGAILKADELGIADRMLENPQQGGESHAMRCLESFFDHRGENYRAQMSSPVTAFDACSRLSPYLSWGCLTVRQVYQIAVVKMLEFKEAGLGSKWQGSLKSFISRLSWHCHFMQKLEDQPNINCVNISRVHDGLRQNSWNEAYYQAWRVGNTGFPFIDANMRALRATGYLNFRMRAMVMSFASYHLWLHWQKPGEQLARYFLDYEPGIHWSQVQMQSGTTGINTIRVYSPYKQSEDQDPEGTFIKQWVPELANVPNTYIHQPHLMPEMEQMFCGVRIGKDYPEPIVDHKIVYQHAQQQLHLLRQTQLAKIEAAKVYLKHGSRKRK